MRKSVLERVMPERARSRVIGEMRGRGAESLERFTLEPEMSGEKAELSSVVGVDSSLNGLFSQE